jgi:transposase-like protein
MKKLIAAVTTAGLLIVGTAGIAQAAETPRAKAEARLGQGKGRRVIAAGQVAAKAIGIEPQELWAAVRDGKSVAEVAQSHDVEPQAVIDAIVAAVNTKVDAAVDAGKIDADRAATIKDKAPARVTKLVNGDLEGRMAHRAARVKVRRHARRAGLAIAAQTIGVEPQALRDAIRGGQSVADVAREHNVEPQAVVDAVVTAANKKIDEAVAADKIDAQRAAKLKERLAARISNRVNGARPLVGAGS